MPSPSPWKKEVAGSFGKAAPEYEQYNAVQERAAQTLCNLLPDIGDGAGRFVLEIGCGTGVFTERLVTSLPQAAFWITDISADMVAACQNRDALQGYNISWAEMDGENPETDKSYDLIVANMAVQWFENLDQSLLKLKALLKPGGRILYSMPAPHSFKEWKSVLEALDLPIGILDFPLRPGMVQDEEYQMKYESAQNFLDNMKRIGAHKARPGYTKLTYSQLKKACRRFDSEYQGQITWHVQYGRICG